MPNIIRVLLFTTVELIVCVTPRARGTELAESGNKEKTIQLLTLECSGRFYSAKPNVEKLLIFLKVSTNFTGDECETMLLI